MDFFDLLNMAGGLALFLYGMNLMGDGLSGAAGGRLEHLLGKLTDHPLKAVAAGAGITALMQSSSAVTVMVVGFVNSGILKLQQAAGVIMGANIGTTITAWLFSLTAIESDHFLIRLCRPSSFSPILALIGAGILLFGKKEKPQRIAAVFLGFAILMFGMDTMSSAVEPLKEVPEFRSFLLHISHPLPGMLAGLVLTAVIQSSSASVGILQALCATGAVSYKAAVPIILGQNIGTCVTALLSGIGTSPNARRAALIHLYFNVIGAMIFLGVFYSLNALRELPFLQETATRAGIAAIHSAFNISATLCLLPFSGLLVKLACLTVRETRISIKNP